MGKHVGGIYQGTLRGRFYINGAWTGIKKAGNNAKFEIKAEADKQELTSNDRETYGNVILPTTIPKAASIGITINDPVMEFLAQGFLGKLLTIADEAGTVTNEAHDAPDPGEGIDLVYRNISSVTVNRSNGTGATTWAATTAAAVGDYVVDTGAGGRFYKCITPGTTAASEPTWPTGGDTVTDGDVVWQDMGPIEPVLNTDYTIGLPGTRLGQVYFSDDALIEKDEPLLIDYSYGARTGYRIEGNASPIAKAQWFFDGKNITSGEDVIIEVYESTNMPNSAIDFQAKTHQAIELTCTPTLIEGKDHPFSIEFPNSVE